MEEKVLLGSENEASFVKEFEDLKRIHGIQAPGTTIMTRVAGSRCFNLNIATSDWDWVGVYVAPLPSLVGLHLKPLVESYVTDKPNTSFHEIRRFAEMLNSGTPAAMESLFCDTMIHMTQPWIQLREMRNKFVTKECINKYIQYGQGQLKKYLAGQPVHTTGGKPGKKWLYHVIRLAKQAFKLTQGELTNNWHTGEEREEILAIRQGNYNEKEVITKARQLFDQAKELLPHSNLPEKAETEILNKWILNVRGIA